MADLRSIMNLDEEHHDAHVNKRDGPPPPPVPCSSRQPHPSSVPAPDYNPNMPGLHPQEHTRQHHDYHQQHHHPQPLPLSHHQRHYYRDPTANMDPNFVNYDQRVGPFAHNSPTPAEDFSSASSSSRVSGHQYPPAAAYRASNTPDEVDQQGYAYGHHVVSSPMGAPAMRAPAGMGPYEAVPEEQAGSSSVKYTPVTGRVSKALKGVPVHTCTDCVPPRTYSRNEHLKRHQLGHRTPAYVCKLPGCGRKFHRKDLLDRHEQKHGFEKEGTPRRGSRDSSRRRSSSATLDFAAAGLGLVYSRPQEESIPIYSSPFVQDPSTTRGDYAPMNPSTPRGSYAPMDPSPRGQKRAREPEPDSNPRPSQQITTEGYRTPTCHSFNYMFPSPSSHPMPVIQEQGSPDHAQTHNHNHNHSDLFRAPPRRPSLSMQFVPPADNPPDLLTPHDPAGIPSSASSTTYSPASELSRHRPFVRSPSEDWVERGGFLAPSPFPHGAMDLLSVGMSGLPVSTGAGDDTGLAYSYGGRAAPLFVTDVGFDEGLPARKRRFTRG